MSQEVLLVPNLNGVETAQVIDGYIASNTAGLKTFEKFDVSGTGSDFEVASAERDAQKAAFLNGEVNNPRLNDCPRFQSESGMRREQLQTIGSLELAQFLHRSARKDAVAEVEDDVLDELLKLRRRELGFVDLAAHVSEMEIGDPNRQDATNLLKTMSRELYGLPDAGRVTNLVAARLEKATEYAEEPDHLLQTIATDLLGTVRVGPIIAAEDPPAMESAMAKHYEQLLAERCQAGIDYAFADIGTDKPIYSVEEMKTLFNRFLQYQGYDVHGWQAEIIPNRTACATKQEQLVIEIGAKRAATQRTFSAVLKSLLHEGEVHAGNYVRGLSLGSKLAGYGLPNYTVFEEPMAAAVPDLQKGLAPKPQGVAYAIAIGLATGQLGEPERDFRQTFEASWRLALMKTYTPNQALDTQVDQARQKAYTNLVRIWRGMPTDVPGCVFTKDRVYENSQLMTALVNNGEPLSKTVFESLFAAHYNPYSPQQVAYIGNLSMNQYAA